MDYDSLKKAIEIFEKVSIPDDAILVGYDTGIKQEKVSNISARNRRRLDKKGKSIKESQGRGVGKNGMNNWPWK